MMKKLLLKKPLFSFYQWSEIPYLLYVAFFAIVMCFLVIKIETSKEHYSTLGYYFNYAVAFFFHLWAFNRTISLRNFLIENIIYLATTIIIGIKFYLFANDFIPLISSIFLYIISTTFKYHINSLDFKKMNIPIDCLFFIKILSIFYSFIPRCDFLAKSCHVSLSDKFYQTFFIITDTQSFWGHKLDNILTVFNLITGNNFLFFVSVFITFYISVKYKTLFVESLFFYVLTSIIFNKVSIEYKDIFIFDAKGGLNWGITTFYLL